MNQPSDPSANLYLKFEPLRATQAAAVLLNRAGGALDVDVLSGLLYLADRHSLITCGISIASAQFCSTDSGPMGVSAASLIVDEFPEQNEIWRKHISVGSDTVRLKLDPGDGELSDFDEQTLTMAISKLFSGHLGTIAFCLRALPEWRNPGLDPCVVLTAHDILIAAGVDPETIAGFKERNKHLRGVERMFAARKAEQASP